MVDNQISPVDDYILTENIIAAELRLESLQHILYTDSPTLAERRALGLLSTGKEEWTAAKAFAKFCL